MTLPGLVAAQNLADVVDREKAWDNLGSSVSANFSISSPSLDLNFAANKSLVDDISGNNLITFSRASTGTFVGSNGLLQTAASGVPRFEYNGATGESLGLLVEEARTNLMLYSQEINNIAWTKSNATITANSIVAPDSTTTADKFVVSTDATSARHEAQQGLSSATNSVTTFSVFLKAGEKTACVIRLYGVAISCEALVNLSSGIIAIIYASNVVSTATSISQLANGWYRCSVTAQNTGTGLVGAAIFEDSVGDGVSGFHVWGAQVEAGSFPTSYIPTVASTVTRAADVASITGANFSSWYRQDEGTLYVEALNKDSTGRYIASINDSSTLNQSLTFYQPTSAQTALFSRTSSGAQANIFATGAINAFNKVAGSYKINDFAVSVNSGTVGTDTSGAIPISTTLDIGAQRLAPGDGMSGTIARIAYYPVRLPDVALQYLTSASGSPSSTTYPYTFAIKGKDTLALNSVSNASARSFVFIKGLTSAAQPRITTAAQQAASGTALRDLALLRNAPSSVGDYYASRGVFDAGTLKINGIQAASLSSSPFSSSTALFPISIRTMELSSNFRLATTFPSGTIASPERAIPVDTTSLILYAKAGQN